MVRHFTSSLAMLLAGLSWLALGCQEASHTHHAEHPYHVEKIDDQHALVTLTAKAAERIDLQTAEVAADEKEAKQLVVPYSSLLYDSEGKTWVYVSSKPRAFKRHSVKVERIEGDNVVLTEGPAVGTTVATVGVVEIYGSEFAVGH